MCYSTVIMVKKVLARKGRVRAGFNDEENDCAVVAVSKALRTSYEHAHTLLNTAGRPNGAGFHAEDFFANYTFKGYDLIEYEYDVFQQLTPKQFAIRNPKGTFLCHTTEHILTIRNGVIFDSVAEDTGKIYKAWEVIKIDKRRKVW